MKGVKVIHILGKFYWYGICFLCWFSIHEMAPFWYFLDPYSPKYCLILLKLLPEVVSNKINTVWKILPNLDFWIKWNAVKFHIGAQFTVGKPKILLKTKIFAKTASLGIINNISSRSQKSQNSFKITPKNTFWVQIGSKLPPWVKGSSQILT